MGNDADLSGRLGGGEAAGVGFVAIEVEGEFGDEGIA